MPEYELDKFEESLKDKIYSIRGFQVMLDFHLAELYNVKVKRLNEQLKLDVKKFNEQYEPVEIVEFDNSHDRFILIEEKVIYHFGASLKDLGRKWFGYSKMEVEAVEMLSRLRDFE